MASRLIAVRDAVAAALEALDGPDGGTAGVVAARWRTNVPKEFPATGDKRVVFVTAPGWAQAETVDRGTDSFDYTVFVTVVELLPDTVAAETAAEDEWLDGRVEWVESLAKSLGDHRAVNRPAPVAALGDVWCQEQEVVEACDEDALREQGLFWSLVRFVIREIPG